MLYFIYISLSMQDIQTIIQILSSGKPVIYPTDTVYGLWCDAANDVAVENLYTLTSRPEHKGLIVLCDSLNMIEKYGEIRFELEKRIIEHCMPWPLTLILDSRHELSALVEQPNGTLWVRIPDHDIALDIITAFGRPIATKSANRSGMVAPTDVNEIDSYFIDHWVMIIDGGICDIQIPSTIIRVIDEDDFQILRQGSMSEDEIRELIA